MTSKATIYTALNVPAVTAYPSPTCLQWSDDGQLYLTTKNAVYIMTPQHGITFDTSSAIKSVPQKEDRDDHQSVNWFRTTVVTSISNIDYSWPQFSTAWGATSFGEIDVNITTTAVSPTDLTPRGGCILAILSSNMDISLWSAGKNGLKGEWNKIFDVVPFLLKHFDALRYPEMTLRAQVTSMAWSQQPDFGLVPNPGIDASLFILGTRAGFIHLLRYHESGMEVVSSIEASTRWITLVSISPFALVGKRDCVAFLSYATDDGGLGLIKIRETLVHQTTISPLGYPEKVSLYSELQEALLNKPDLRVFTTLKWVNTRNGNNLLVGLKPGILFLWSDEHEGGLWTGSMTLQLPAESISVGSSSRYPPSGIEYLAEQDTLVLTFHDGSFRVLENICSSPRWVVDGSPSLSTRVRTLVERVEGRTLQFSDMTRVCGSISLDGSNTWIWGHELHRPSEFMYKHEAQMNLKFVVADIGDELPLEQIYSGLQNILLSPQVWPKKPIAMLRTFFANIRRSQYFLELHPRILNLLNSPFEDPSCGIQINPVSAQPLTSGLRKEFRHCILRFLYGWPNLVTLRARLPVTDFLYNLSTDEILREACRKTGQFLFNSIGWMNLRIFIRLAKAVASLVTENDLPFVLRVLVQSGLPDAPPDIVSEGQALAEVIHGFTGLSWDAFMNSDSLKETCPACHGEVPFAHLSEATCVNGHQWRRCSITTFILCTSHLRTCIGCSRKAFLPLSAESEPIKEGEERKNWLPQVGKGWIVEELLEGVNRCLFCGNSFVAVV